MSIFVKTVRITVSGRVQGVFFRKFTKEKCEQLNITGEVRNLPNGSVQLLVTGTEPELNELIAWCRHGPSRAEVSDIWVETQPTTLFSDFRIMR